jgi:Cys-tRNA(Pro)/Cys-tRNA(Cys) deacylase
LTPSIETTITRILDDRGIPYRVLLHKTPVYTVDDAAEQRGVAKREMVKCILLRDKDGHYVMACVPGDVEVDPRAVRRLMPDTWRRLSFAKGKEISDVTGCPQGAVAPIGLPKGVPLIFDPLILKSAKVNVSSGDPLAGLEVDPKDLVEVCNANIAPISRST